MDVMFLEDWQQKEFRVTVACQVCKDAGVSTKVMVEKRHKMGDTVRIICPRCETPLVSYIPTDIQ